MAIQTSDDDRLSDLLLDEEVKQSYLTYAMSVLIDRALPDLRDGLKPVHRRILQSMRDLNLTAGAKHQKSAKIVGQCLGNYHPHGDTSVYDAMVRMAQDFSLRYQLVDGQGNFGALSGDPAAAYRYTEARMTRFAEEMLSDIQCDTVDFKPNFDGTMEEPTVLPARLPNLLVNGCSGIAVGMATNIPPHNLGEICRAIIHLIDNPACTVGDLMHHVRGPDFPTRGIICGTAGLREAYETGRGRVVMRARIEKREESEGRWVLTVTELPYGLRLPGITESIGNAHRDERIKGLTRVTDLSSGDLLRLEIELKRGEDPDVFINQLYQLTNLQSTFNINMIALDGGRPRTVSLKRMCQAYVEHRIDVLVRRTRFLLARDEARLHIVDGLLKAIDIIDAIIAMIRAASGAEDARNGLIREFAFSERQAQAILDMQLRRLTGLERDKLLKEQGELSAAIADYLDILGNSSRQYAIIKADLQNLIDRYDDERRTEIITDPGDLSMEDLIEDLPCVVTITNSGYIRRLPIDTFRTQRRGGKGVAGSGLKDDEDFVARVFTATNHQYLLIFTNFGKVYWLKVYAIPEASRISRGRALANVLSLGPNERISETIPVREFRDDQFLLMATARGQIKKTALSAYGNPRPAGIIAMRFGEDDHLVDVVITNGDDEILIATNDGQACRFHESECRARSRDTSGVVAIDLSPDARVVSLLRLEPGTEVLTICEKGFGKRTPYTDYRLTRRGGKGVINIETSERNGPVLASVAVRAGDELMLMSRLGMAVRTRVDDIRTTGRAAQGVKIIELAAGDSLSGFARCPRENDIPGADGAAGATPTPVPMPTPPTTSPGGGSP